MCEFCHKHGEGEIWYLQEKNYFNQFNKLNKSVERVFGNDGKWLVDSLKWGETYKKAPKIVQKLVREYVVRKQKKEHFGQIIPIEDVEKILSFTKAIVRISCICRKATLGKEVRYCYGLSMNHDNFKEHPGYKGDVEILTKEQAMKEFRKLDKNGLIHSIWTFTTPYIGGICNCDYDCVAFKSRLKYNVPVFFKAEYFAKIDYDKCNGCKTCMKQCMFGAISFSLANKKCNIDEAICYGCGICRSVCTHEAISFSQRSKVSSVKENW